MKEIAGKAYIGSKNKRSKRMSVVSFLYSLIYLTDTKSNHHLNHFHYLLAERVGLLHR